MARHKSGRQRDRTRTAITPADTNKILQQVDILLQQGQTKEAAKICKKTLKKIPDEPALLNVMGYLDSLLGKSSDAEKHLERATQIAPNNANYHYNLGKIFLLNSKQDKAIASFNAALAINPNFSKSYFSIAKILEQRNQLTEAIDYYNQSLRCNPHQAEAHYNLSTIYRTLHQLKDAYQHCCEAINLRPNYALAYDRLGTILSESNRLHESLKYHKQALRYDPGLAEAHYNLSVALKELDQLTEALDHCREAINLQPGYALAYSLLGFIYAEQYDWQSAIKYQHSAIELQPDEALFYEKLAIIYMNQGDLINARKYFQQAIDRQPDSARAIYSLAMISTHDVDDPAIATMQKLYNQTETNPENRILLEFGLGKAYDDAGEYDLAFNYYLQGNQHYRTKINYNLEKHFAFVKDLMELLDTDLLSQSEMYGSNDSTPIFIIGMPRSGTTLIEQILSMHSDVTAAGEKKFLPYLYVQELDAENTEERRKKCSKQLFETIGKKYIKKLRQFLPTTKHITDKMPHNFLYVGLIALALPKAKIIHCQRNPVDTCLSCFTKLFELGHYYSYDLQELGNYYSSYQEIMAHWHKLLPGKILDVQYENIINDLEPEAKRLINYCDLPWNNSCLEFYRSDRPVKTASLNQVNKPIYRNSMQRWKHYERHLEPLLAILNKSSKI